MEEAQKKRAAAAAARWTATVVTIALLGGALATAAALLGWWDAAVMCLLGVASGLFVSYAVLEAPGHRQTAFFVGLAFGMVVLPAFAAYLGLVATAGGAAFATWNVSFTPFLTFALGTVAVRLVLARIWRPRTAEAEEPEEAEEAEQTEWQALRAEVEAERPASPPVGAATPEGV